MKNLNVISIDLAKNIFQVAVITAGKKCLFNKPMSRKKLAQWLIQQPKSLVIMEACGSMHFWAWKAQSAGHEVKAIPPQYVTPYRQGHKTDHNDALAIAEAGQRPQIKAAPIKSVEQLTIQSINRARALLNKEKVSTSNHIRAMLLEYGITFRKGYAHLKRHIPMILECADNDFPIALRSTLHRLYQRFIAVEADIAAQDKELLQLINQNTSCKQLQDMEGIGPICASLLYASLGNGEAFKNGREASAYIGMTPRQFSSGGKVTMLGIGKGGRSGNCELRSALIQGARSVVHQLKAPKTKKQQWLFDLIKRSGYGKAAVALANKNIRTAWAMLNTGQAYQVA